MSSPRVASVGAVSGGHPCTVAAGAEALRAGGNAVDAVVAAALAATVCEPLLTGLAGGGLFTVRTPEGRVEVVEGFSAFPGLEHGLIPGEFDAIRIDYGPLDQAFHVGRGSVAVPGAAAVIEALWRRHGRLPLAALVAPALELVEQGYIATRTNAVVASALERIVRTDSRGPSQFYRDGQLPKAGERLGRGAMREALRIFGEDGAQPFIDGAPARALAEACGPPAGSLSLRDLAAFKPEVRRPIEVPYLGATIHLPPPPCVGGALIAFGLGVLARLHGHLDDGLLAAARILVMDETERARREGFDHDPFSPDALVHLLDPARADAVAERVYKRVLTLPRGLGSPASPPGNPLGNTTHVSAVDAEGLAVSWTSSNGETAGRLWPGLDIPLNNFLGEADLHPLGFHRGRPGARLRTMMSPTVVTWPDGGVVALGTGGANRIRTTMLQVLHHLCSGQTLRDAVTAPRVHVEGGVVSVESARSERGAVEVGAAMGFGVAEFAEPHLYFGGVHAVARGADGRLDAVGDSRRDGAAVVLEER